MPAPTGAQLAVEPTNWAVAKGLGGLILTALALYFLSTGKKYNDPGRLFWAAMCSLSILALFVV